MTGAGSAGCVLAARLSEFGRYRVLRLEAGERDRNPWIHIPMDLRRLFTDPGVNWMYESEPEAQLNGRALYQPRGKVFGGTSSINGMVYMRGMPADYDVWRQPGCMDGTGTVCCPISKRPKIRTAAQTSSTARAARYGFEPGARGWATRWLQAAIEAGIPANADFNGASAGRSRLLPDDDHNRPLEHRDGLSEPSTNPQRISQSSPTRTPPAFFSRMARRSASLPTPGCRMTARCRGEVIISGGVFNSPQLLQLSGLGPAEHLRQFGIPLIRDMPGVAPPARPFQRLPGVALLAEGDDQRSSRRPRREEADGRRTIRFHPLRALSNAGIYAGAFVKSDPRLEQPDLQINMFGWSPLERLRTGTKPHPFSAFTMSARWRPRPDGRGTVRLKSPDPLAPPDDPASISSPATTISRR